MNDNAPSGDWTHKYGIRMYKPEVSGCAHRRTPNIWQEISIRRTKWQHGSKDRLKLGYSCESQVITVCQDIADSLDKGDRIDAIIIYFFKAFDLVPHDRLLMKIAISGFDSRVVAWIREFLLGRTQRVKVGGQLSGEVRVTSGVPQGSVLGPLLFLAYVNDIWRNIDPTIGLFADDCVIYIKKILKTRT